ncbi:tRNA (adenosine(37)-N6)-threonylcarbamoyltransferase complex dimerization subunit type 1 TsaB [Thorsellia kenyensis]|uniref:tRNA threonylcarbamoyladenosine biosynthesis protein TsaB n=1 Tax=Thorsellia kenyensis TaxID=1549888 RepID=A0ABV6CAS9_9GAMM
MNIEYSPIQYKLGRTLLAVDTATESCSAALLHQGKISSMQIDAPREHTEKILPMVDALLNDAQVSLKEIEAIVFGEGPGSFTGVRVGVSVAQALSFGINKPLIAISNLLALAQGAYALSGHTSVISAIDARMGEVYVAGYQFNCQESTWTEFINPMVISPSKLIDLLNNIKSSVPSVVAGTGFQTYPELYSTESIKPLYIDSLNPNLILLPHAKEMITLAIGKLENADFVSAFEAEPMYLRNEVTWQKLPGK